METEQAPARPGMRLRSDPGEPYVLVVPQDPVVDHRLSAAELGVYLRCRWLMSACAPSGPLHWLIAELGMPEDETRAAVDRLVELGHIDTVGQVETEFDAAQANDYHVRDAAGAVADALAPHERAAVARFADLVDQRRDQAVTAVIRSEHPNRDTPSN